MPNDSPRAKPAHLLKADQWQFEYRQKCNSATSHLDWLGYGTYRIAPGATSDELFHRGEEALLFSLAGTPVVEIDGETHELSRYDTLYVPLASPYRISNPSSEEGHLVVCRAVAERRHPVYFSSWAKVSNDEARIRRLEGKDVYLMFDTSESADRLLAGYTIYQPRTRAWPPHNHTDQEEIYIFTHGRGAMEVYADEKHKTFVHSMETFDAATIPLLNYHPVFSQEESLHFIWCLAGKRYWIGDAHPQFLDGSVDQITT